MLELRRKARPEVLPSLIAEHHAPAYMVFLLGLSYGIIIWDYYMGLLYGIIIWDFYMGLLYGIIIWDYY